MRKKNYFVLGLTLFISISSSSCDIDGFIDQANTYLSSVNSWIGEAGENIGNWWEQTYSDLDDWWNKAEDDFSSWWSNTKNSAADLYNEITNKLLETYDYLVCKTDETIDDVVGAVASAIKRSYSKNFESIVPVSNRSFDNISIDEFTEEMFYNDELFAYDEEAFVYKLVRSIIPTSYETFPAVLIVEEDEEILGLAYADYSKIFESDDLKYVPTGFIAFESEAPLYDEYLNYTYEIKRLDGFDEGYSYFLSYLPESYKTHCVALNKYFVFGIDENYKIFYSINDYVSSNVEKLGKLYSFDKNDFIANLNEDSYFGNTNLVEQIKYFSRSETEIKAELYDYFKNFSINVKEFDIKNIFGLVKGSVNDVFGANNIVSSISNLTIEDIFDTKIDMDQIPTSSSLFPKWAIITGCVLSIIVSIAIAVFPVCLSPIISSL